MGSAQSARRIQPGGGSGRVGGPADLSRPPFLPTPPPALPSPRRPSSSSPEGAGSGGCGGGRAGPGVGSAGDRPPTGDRPPPGAFPPRRCAATGSGTAGKARRGRWLGGPRPSSSSHPVSAPPAPRPPPGGRAGRGGGGGGGGGGTETPPSVTAPRQQHSPNPGAEGARPVAALSPLPAPTPAGISSARGVSPAGARRRLLVGGPGHPSHGATALPPLLPATPLSRRRGRAARGSGGGADCPQCAPGGSRRRARGGGSLGATRASPEEGDGGAERTGSAAMSATHPTRLETRTKESNTCASRGLARKPPWRNEGEGRRALAGRGGIPRPLQSAEGAPPARLARRAGEVEHERTC